MGGRGWAGTTLADRQADRHRRLLDVGLDLLGRQGSAAVTVRSVCRSAQLTDRYFYENFADREALLLAVYDAVAAEARAVLVAAVEAATPGDPGDAARRAVLAFLDLLTDDPRKGRVLLLEPQVDQTLRARGAAIAPGFEDIIRAHLADPGAGDAQLTATALVGALTNLLVRWLDGSLAVGRAELTEFCVRLLLASYALAEPVSPRARRKG